MLVVPLCCTLLAPSPAPQETLFVDRTQEYGLEFTHSDSAFAYAMGGGSAWLDHDQDGDEDLFVANSEGRHELFRNDGGSFSRAVVGSGLIDPLVPGAIAVGAADYDGDGWIDLFLPSTGANRLMQNQGDGTFVDRAAVEGVDSDRWSATASWADFDRDGDLDLYVGNYVEDLNFPYHYGSANLFYENLGPAAPTRFVERAAELGVDDAALFGPSVPGFPYMSPEGQPTAGCTLSTCTLDVDEDGDPDLLVGNDFGEWVTPNKFFRNDLGPDGALAFTDVTEATDFGQRPHYNMGVAGADYDKDGDWDFYKTNLGDNLLLRNDEGLFTDVVYEAGPVSGETDDGELLISSWGIVWADLDLDRDEDLYVVNGLIPAAGFIENDPRAENDLHLNQGDGTFERVAPELSGAADDGAGRGVAPADVNRDGFVDFHVMNNGGFGVAFPGDGCRLYVAEPERLDPGGERRALQLRLRATASHWEAIGARVEAEVAGEVLRRQVLADTIFVSSGSREVHFGLGTAPAAERVVVHWPSGTEQQLIAVPAGAQLTVVEPRVLLDELLPVDFAGGASPAVGFAARVENRAATEAQVTVLFDVRLGEDGPSVLLETVSGALGGGETTTVPLTVPVDPVLVAALAGLGLEFDVRAYVLADGAVDSRRRVDPLP